LNLKLTVMARIPGIKFIKDSKGNPKQVVIDLKKHGKEIKPFLENIGAIEEDDFEKEWKEAITGDELLERINKHIDTLPWKE
jgi:hypothetical protein